MFLVFVPFFYPNGHICHCIPTLQTQKKTQLNAYLTLKCRHPKEFLSISLLIRENSTTVIHHEQFECWFVLLPSPMLLLFLFFFCYHSFQYTRSFFKQQSQSNPSVGFFLRLRLRRAHLCAVFGVWCSFRISIPFDIRKCVEWALCDGFGFFFSVYLACNTRPAKYISIHIF